MMHYLINEDFSKYCKLNIIRMVLSAYLLFFLMMVNNDSSSAINVTPDDLIDTIFLRVYIDDVNTFKDKSLNDSVQVLDYMNKNKSTAIYWHGFTESAESISVNTVVNAFMIRTGYNVIAVDWSKIAGQDYIKAVKSVVTVAKHIANALNRMLIAGFSCDTLDLVAHSLGVHVAGATARNMNCSVPRIFGLDPAGPLFDIQLFGIPISKDDAEVVLNFHTDAGNFGSRRLGAIDFWPNDGKRVQPDCPEIYTLLSSEDFCSHHLSWKLFAASLLNDTIFLATKCSKKYKWGVPTGEPIPMGLATPLHARGNYYLKTLGKPPYGMGEAGAKCIHF